MTKPRTNARKERNIKVETTATVWPDLAKFCHFGKILKIFGNFMRVLLVFCNLLNLFWKIQCALRPIYIVVNGQILSKHFRHLVTLDLMDDTNVGNQWPILEMLYDCKLHRKIAFCTYDAIIVICNCRAVIRLDIRYQYRQEWRF